MYTGFLDVAWDFCSELTDSLPLMTAPVVAAGEKQSPLEDDDQMEVAVRNLEGQI